jgi:hypothetical protein
LVEGVVESEVMPMTGKMTRAERKAAFAIVAEQLFDEMEIWYDNNPDATFEALEDRARHSRRTMMGKALEIWINGRGTGKQSTRPRCPDCDQKMEDKGRVQKTVYGVEGDTQLQRTYYRCPNKCEAGAFFPSGPALAIES